GPFRRPRESDGRLPVSPLPTSRREKSEKRTPKWLPLKMQVGSMKRGSLRPQWLSPPSEAKSRPPRGGRLLAPSARPRS
ncbi:hypothetical protein TGMAS_366310, partial [Toxoplasma gondii MAS]